MHQPINSSQQAAVDLAQPIVIGPVESIMQVIGQAGALQTLESPLLVYWETSEITGEPENEILKLVWESDGLRYRVVFTEEGIAAGEWLDNGYRCKDSEGENEYIEFFTLSPLTAANITM